MPGRTAISPDPSNDTPLIAFLAPWSTGIAAADQVDPLSVLSQAPDPRSEITVAAPCEVAKSMFPGVAPASVSPSCAAVSRCQRTPSGETHSTAWRPELVLREPPARKPSGVLVTTLIESPGCRGLMP